MWGSNYTFFVEIEYDDQTFKGVYKPVQGEKPLWDFPAHTLAGREVAAYLVSEAGGWHHVPPTVYRAEGPSGAGSLQFYVEHNPEHHYFNFSDEEKARLRTVALFDVIINNTDRKGGHVLVEEGVGRFWLIDHGVCFHAQPKLRTVIWDFAGEALTGEECSQLNILKDKLVEGGGLFLQLSQFLNDLEILAISYRIKLLLDAGGFPSPSEDRYSYPWPPI